MLQIQPATPRWFRTVRLFLRSGVALWQWLQRLLGLQQEQSVRGPSGWQWQLHRLPFWPVVPPDLRASPAACRTACDHCRYCLPPRLHWHQAPQQILMLHLGHLQLRLLPTVEQLLEQSQWFPLLLATANHPSCVKILAVPAPLAKRKAQESGPASADSEPPSLGRTPPPLAIPIGVRNIRSWHQRSSQTCLPLALLPPELVLQRNCLAESALDPTDAL